MMRRLVGLLAFVGACRAVEPASPVPRTAKAAPAADTPTEIAAPPRPTCDWTAGMTTETLAVDGTTREYLRWVGPDAAADAPVVFAWHGFGSNPGLMLRRLRPEQFWPDAVVIAPLGLGRTFEQFGDTERPGWQVYAGELDDRDLRLFDALSTDLQARGCGDPTRHYTTGFSNGGFFSNVLACHRGAVIAAAAPTGGGGPFVTGCGPAAHVLVMHGRQDDIVDFSAATKTWTFWTGHDGCDPAPAPEDGTCVTATNCRDDAEVILCAFAGPHAWPAGHAARVAEFLRRHARTPKSGMTTP